MAVYPESVANLIREPIALRDAEGGNALGTDVNFSCGCFARVTLKIDEETGSIEAVHFRSNGCGFMVAAATMLSGFVNGKLLTELHGLSDSEILESRQKLELHLHPDRQACFGTALDAVKAALNDYRSRKLEEYSGEKALICTCFGISEETVEAFVRTNSIESADDVARSIRAGSGCGSCRMLIQEIIDSHAPDWQTSIP